MVPSFDKTDTDKPSFMHLFLGKNDCKITADKKDTQGNIILLDSNVKHIVKMCNGCDLFLLIDPGNTIAEQFLVIFEKTVSHLYGMCSGWHRQGFLWKTEQSICFLLYTKAVIQCRTDKFVNG